MTDAEKLARFNDVWVCTRCGLVGGTLAIHATKCDYEPAPSITIESLIAACEARGWDWAAHHVGSHPAHYWLYKGDRLLANSEGPTARAALEAAILMALEASE